MKPNQIVRLNDVARSQPTFAARVVVPVAVLGVLLVGAIFGFFYAWVCSTMWGLDAADPEVAIRAMQAMNASVRNGVFFPAFFLSPVVLAAASAMALLLGRRRAAGLLVAAAVTYLVGGLFVTATINVPLNEGLALVDVPPLRQAASQVWNDYSQTWQRWNVVRAIASGLSLLLASLALLQLRPSAAPVVRN